MGKSAAKAVLGGAIAAFSFANKSFGLFRSFDYLHKNTPQLFDLVTSSRFEITLIVIGLSLGVVGVFEILSGKKSGSSAFPASAGVRSAVSARDQSRVASVGSIGNIGQGATVNIGTAHGHAQSTGRPVPPRANIIYCGFRRTEVFVGPWPFTGVREPTNDEEFNSAVRGVVIKFENDVWTDGNGHRAMNVLAKAIYRFANGPELRIDYAVWMGAAIRFESLNIGDTRELLLILHSKTDDGLPEFNALNDNRDINDHFSNPFTWFRHESFGQPVSIQVTVIEQQSRAKYVFEFEVNDSGADIGVTLKSTGN